MLILAIDTSGRQGSVALLRQQGEELVTLSLAPLSGGQYSERLLPTIAELLLHHQETKSAIGLIAVASGPGSFTGLRIAVATVKGLAEAQGTPVVAVSVLEVIAINSGAEGRIVAALDAQRSEVFFGEYSVASSNAERIGREGMGSFEDFTGLLASTSKIFTPDPDLAARIQEAGFDVQARPRPSAEDFGRIAHRKFLAGVCSDVATLDANYLRRSDAEILIAPKPRAVPL